MARVFSLCGYSRGTPGREGGWLRRRQCGTAAACPADAVPPGDAETAEAGSALSRSARFVFHRVRGCGSCAARREERRGTPPWPWTKSLGLWRKGPGGG